MSNEKKVVADYPELLSEWDYIRNTDIKPDEANCGSHKKVWWKCDECGHEWQASISNRTKGRSCPLCSNHVTVKGKNDLATKCPDLLKEWDFEKNTDIQPKTVYYMSTLKAWWKCRKCGRSWQSMIRNRSEKGVGCAVCSGKACGTGINDLETLYPELLEEFDLEKNKMKPNEVAAHSATMIWWKCKYCGKSWKTAASNRTGKWKTGCPHCNSEYHTSFPEQALLYYIKQFYTDVINGYIIQGSKELDIYIPSLQIAIEYDGVAWHTDKEKDEKKNKDCVERGITLIRVREKGLSTLQTPYTNYNVIPNDLNSLEKVIILLLSNELNISSDKIDVNLTRDTIKIQSGYRTIKQDKSLSALFPEIAEEWSYEKNGELTPDKISFGSGLKVWWKCKECGNEWKTDVSHRTSSGRGCPKCRREKAHNKFMTQMLEKTVTLQDGYPDVAKEWHKQKNGEQSPATMAAMSGKKVWWQCSVCGNEWQATISNRTKQGAGCPECARLRSRNKKKCRKILCVETNRIYNSIAEIEREMGINHACIIACCKGKHQTAGGFHWKYADEEDTKA